MGKATDHPTDDAADAPDDGEAPTARAAWCGWCGAALLQPPGAGRPRRWCKASCRQQAHVARKLADAAGLTEDQVVVSRRDYDELQERLAALRAAVADVERIPPLDDDAVELRRALDWVLLNARQV